MSDTLEYIDSYFNNDLAGEEKKAFEERCIQDQSFAAEVAIYVSARAASRELLLLNKRKDWEAAPVVAMNPVAKTRRVLPQWVKYAVAACLLISVGVNYWNYQHQPIQFAKSYIKENYGVLSQTMGGDADSISLGIEAYNKKDYKTAETIFTSVARSNPANADAKEYAGLVYLASGNYDKAIEYFDALANMKGLYSNPGIFMEAITLIIRDAPGDVKSARILLEKVVREDLEEKQKAQELLPKLKD